MLRRSTRLANLSKSAFGAGGSVVSTLLTGQSTTHDLIGSWTSLPATASNTSSSEQNTTATQCLFTTVQSQAVRSSATKDFRQAVLSAPQHFYVQPTTEQLAGNSATNFTFAGYASVDAPSAVLSNNTESTFTATPNSGDEGRSWTLTGSKTILRNADGGKKGDSCIVFAEHNKDLVALAVAMPESGAFVATGNKISYNVDLTGVKATKLDSQPGLQGLALADFALAQARISHACLVSGALDAILKDLLIYVTTTARNDHTLYKTTSTQGHLAAIAGAKFALDAMIDLCGSTEAPGAAVADFVKLYSSCVITDTLYHAAQIVKFRGSPEITAEMIVDRPPLSEEFLSADAKAAGAKLPSMAGVHFTTLKALQTFAPTLHHADCPLGSLKLNAMSKFGATGASAAGALASLLAPMDLSFQKAIYGIPAVVADSAALSKILEKSSAKNKDGGVISEGEHLIGFSADLTTNLLASVAIMAKATASGLTENPAVAGEHRSLAAVQLELNAFKRKKIIADASRKSYSGSIEKMMKQSAASHGQREKNGGLGYFSTHPTELKMK